MSCHKAISGILRRFGLFSVGFLHDDLIVYGLGVMLEGLFEFPLSPGSAADRGARATAICRG